MLVNSIKHYTEQMSGGVEVQPHELWTLTLNGKWLVSCPYRFTPGVFFWLNVGWAPDLVLTLWKQKIHATVGNWALVVQPVA
jgi:hypothetical protein